MSRLIVISNRVALPGKSEAGGLAVALRESLAKKGGLWCGWSGKVREYPKKSRQIEGNIDYLTMDFTQADHDEFYTGFSNSLLWPLFHYRMGLTHYTQEIYKGYQRVNHKFAQAVAPHLKPSDTVWVHDYQLLTCGEHLRRMDVKNRIGFFLHIPFPVPEVLAALPVHKEIIEAMCSYDLIGFQTDSDLQAFLRCVSEMLGGRKWLSVQDNAVEVQVGGRKFRAGVFPISIDTKELAATAVKAEQDEHTRQLKKSLYGRQMMIGVDRLDYTKGLTERLEAYHMLLQSHQEWNGKISYIQITPPSRTDVEDYRDIREQIESLAARINGVNASVDWVPIRYVNKSFERKALAGFYRTARVGLVTPLRDGMNLVAKEYVACQNPADPGVLVLSEFAGAARELDAAVLVNPYDKEALSMAMHHALCMSLEERKERHQAMLNVLKRNDIVHWTKSFLSQLTLPQEKIIHLPTPVIPSLYHPAIETAMM